MRSILKTLVFAALAFCLFLPCLSAQELPPTLGQTGHRLFYYDTSNNLEYVCWAQAQNAVNTFKRSDSTLTNIVDAATTATATTASAHGLTTGATVVITGATEDTDLNGTYTITVTGATTFTFTSASVTDATYTESTLVVTYTGPRDTVALWAIQRLFYSTNLLVKSAWASGTPKFDKSCSLRATYQYR